MPSFHFEMMLRNGRSEGENRSDKNTHETKLAENRTIPTIKLCASTYNSSFPMLPIQEPIRLNSMAKELLRVVKNCWELKDKRKNLK